LRLKMRELCREGSSAATGSRLQQGRKKARFPEVSRPGRVTLESVRSITNQ
jgi:hypothetical protein